ncbi:hypothetical protein PQX77_021993 [Marasmius sp. AFHP31]|nr:hypothetical protein PQX77_021993 [Marasmius sp. AFHP31]
MQVKFSAFLAVVLSTVMAVAVPVARDTTNGVDVTSSSVQEGNINALEFSAGDVAARQPQIVDDHVGEVKLQKDGLLGENLHVRAEKRGLIDSFASLGSLMENTTDAAAAEDNERMYDSFRNHLDLSLQRT